MKTTLAEALITHDDAQKLVDQLVCSFSDFPALQEKELALRVALRSLEEAYLSLEAAKARTESDLFEL